MKFLLLICVVFPILFEEVTSQTVSCEEIENYTWGHGYGLLKTCYMRATTSIESDEFVISPADSSVEAIRLDNNHKIHFLPIRVDETFPNLVIYYAYSCSIKTVSKKNLKNLKKLKGLYLNDNQIERINRDTFEDLSSLEELSLYNNKIKEIDGAAFEGLNSLTKVYLQRNVCIDKEYKTSTAIATLIRESTEKCGFTEVEETTENISNVVQSSNVSRNN